jgi:hypothetical protein
MTDTTNAENSLIPFGLSPEQSKIIVAAIAAGKVPHVHIEY